MAVKRWNGTAWEVYAGSDLAPVKVTDGRVGKTTFIGATTPTGMIDGDIWIDQDTTTNAVVPTALLAKGDIFVATGNGTYTRLAAGNNGETLYADSTTSTGLRWQGDLNVGKNKILNGDFSIWQRGTSSFAGVYTADRWYADAFSVASRSTDVPSGQPFTYSIRHASISVNSALRQAVELPAVGRFGMFRPGSTWTVSFWTKSTQARDVRFYAAFTIGNGGTPESVPVDAVVLGTSAVNTWQRWTHTFTIPSNASITNASCFQITPFIQGNGVAIDTFITGVQLEEGSVATPFTTNTGNPQAELAACQRYYWRMSSDSVYQAFGMGFWEPSSSIILTFVDHPVPMRVAPTSIDFTGPFIVYDGTGGIAVNSITIGLFGSRKRSRINLFLSSSGTSTRPYELLSNNSTAPFIGFNAEI